MTGKALMLGIDGLGAAFLESPLALECMPATNELFGGSPRKLRSTIPPYTGPAWTTITTGVDPGRHGVFGFTDRTGRPNSDRDVHAPRVWDYVGAAGGRSLVVNVPLTYPAREIEGILVSGMPTPPNTVFSAPTEVGAEIDRVSGGYIVDVPVLGTPRATSTLARLATMTDARRKAILHLMGRESWDLVAVVFVLPDRLGHPWWKQLVPGDPMYDTKRAEAVRAAARESLRALDRAVSDILAAAPAGTGVIACSDHGFGPLHGDVFFDVALAEAGLMPKPSSGPVGSVLRRAANTPLTRAVPRKTLEAMKRKMAQNVARTDAQAWTAPKFEGGVYLGDPADADARRRVVELLGSVVDDRGEPVVREVLSAADAFSGPFVDAAPQLLPVMHSESNELHEGLHARDVWVSRDHVAWGTHRYDGVVEVKTSRPLVEREARVADVTPTLLAFLGLGVEDLDGASLVEPGQTEKVAATGSGSGSAYSAEEEGAIMEHLKGLGYVE